MAYVHSKPRCNRYLWYKLTTYFWIIFGTKILSFLQISINVFLTPRRYIVWYFALFSFYTIFFSLHWYLSIVRYVSGNGLLSNLSHLIMYIFFIALKKCLPLHLVGSENMWSFNEEYTLYDRRNIPSLPQEYKIYFVLVYSSLACWILQRHTRTIILAPTFCPWLGIFPEIPARNFF